MRPARLLLLVLLLPAACTSRPVDPEGTLDRVRGGTLRAGIVANDPWTIVGPPHDGIEVEIVERFAASIDSEVEWFDGSEQELFGALHLGELDLVVGGFEAQNPYAAEVAFTHPYFTSRVVVAIPSAEEVPEDIAGVEVAVEKATEAAGILAKTDAESVPVEDVTKVEGPRAIDDWLLDDLDLVDTGTTLVDTDHVMALRLGENGFMVELEDFLLSNANEIEEIVNEEGAP